MESKAAASIVLALTLLFLTGCGKPYVGQTTNYNHPAWHRVYSIPCSGKIDGTGPLIVNFKLERTEQPNGYRVTGEFDPTHGEAKSWDHILVEKSRFSMLISEHGIIVDNISFMVHGTNLGRPLPFRFEFQTEFEIDAVAFDYEFWMRG
ncbi:MAG: hypothetical protein ACOWWM_18430 [Desulfobacterales bacterium]